MPIKTPRKRTNKEKKRFVYKYPPGYYSKEQKEERARDREYRAGERERKKEEKATIRLGKQNYKIELAILTFMLKNDVLYHHHGSTDSLKDSIKSRIEKLKAQKTDQDYILRYPIHMEYNSYVWNRYGEGKNYMSLSLLGRLWSSSEFETIYDVPLDGTYKFHTSDSGQRGLGSFDYMTATKIDKEVKVKKVNPGGLPPIFH